MTQPSEPNTNAGPTRSSPIPAPSPAPSPRPVPRAVLCPYCGEVSKNHKQCSVCGGRFDHLSRQATQNTMGPWQIRDREQPFRPGCSFEVIKGMVVRGKIGPATVLRGPTTRQFWTPAKRVPSVSNLLGTCHNCEIAVPTSAMSCSACGASFEPEADRQYFGLMPVRLLPGQASADVVAASALGIGAARSAPQSNPAPVSSPEQTSRHATVSKSAPSASVPVARAPAPAVEQRPPSESARAMERAIESEETRESASMGRGLKATLVIFLVGAAVVMSAILFVTLAPMAGIELPEWVPTIAKLVSSNPTDDSLDAAVVGPGVVTDSISSADAAGSDSSMLSSEIRPEASESIAQGAADPNEPSDSSEPSTDLGVVPIIAQIRSLLASGDEGGIRRAIELIDELPVDAPIAAILLKSAEDLRLFRSIVGTL